jgi:hypothetical protein
MDQGEQLLWKDQWRAEAQAVIADISTGLRTAVISEALGIMQDAIFLNIEILEGKRFCVELSPRGFAVVGDDFDKNVNEDRTYFETPYSLLDGLSPEYRNNFYKRLSAKLEALDKNSD